MAVANFLQNHLKECKDIINALLQKEDTFTSHDFIEKLRARFPNEYISWLGMASDNNIVQFQTVNATVAKFLSGNDTILGIEKYSKMVSKNDHGNMTSAQAWQKIRG